MAERQGFEPWEGYKPSTVFKTAAFDHSATSPKVLYYRKEIANASFCNCLSDRLALAMTSATKGLSCALKSAACGLGFMSTLDDFHGIAVGIAAEQCFSARLAQTVADAGLIQVLAYGIDGIGCHGEMPVPAAMRRPTGGGIGVFQFQQMDLLSPHLQPCTVKAHIGPIRQRQFKNPMIEIQCFSRIGDQKTDMMQCEVEF